ncbi:small, acid-soluble spore protein, H family [Robertmurraya beringensis]|uniref:Small, acid-soluble spore protein, H family n=1 Tax=Robertmurraya beringensis TaxID=641660 RepID=A0ABV6KUA1_9BACI
MDSRRVKQILSSSADIHVEYNGASVWIDELHEDGKTACNRQVEINSFSQISLNSFHQIRLNTLIIK